ncbi:hypothetical protein PFLCHA0_c31480 [Pseudomonas protegens CHA0]|uniref:Uncharacterized protein n=1 Tax=Pseudomonas protegens (strain DSM 19095 / LMG 27888 / CFBP 6595 / CHA0) TaxID=1124983 RepID=A0A2C9EN08_PSEPH|nr:hypothetical protein PFLCHA0_c31480 [Pseudomonas protegens CHA0]
MQQLPDLLEGLLPAGLPVAANDAVRLAVLLQPMAGSLEERQAFCQLWLAALAIVAPGHIFRRQQQVQVVVAGQQLGFQPRRAVAEQGLAPELVA